MENAEVGSFGMLLLVISLLIVHDSSMLNPLMMGCWMTLLFALDAMDCVELYSCSLILGMELVLLLVSKLLVLLFVGLGD